MLPDRQPANRTAFRTKRSATCLLVTALLAACSTMPDAGYPAHADHRFRARYVVGDDGRLPFLSTSKNVVLHRLELQPRPRAEHFQDENRWFVYPPQTTVEVHGALRAYADAAGSVPKLKDLLQSDTALLLSVVTF